MPEDENELKKLEDLLAYYSAEDLLKSFFVLNLWLPNVSSHTKSQYWQVPQNSDNYSSKDGNGLIYN
jgi:hypothetical protein